MNLFNDIATLGGTIQRSPEIAFWALGGMAALGLGLRLVTGGRPEQEVHGSARWATPREVKRAGLYSERGVVLGKHAGRILRHDGPEHILLIGPTRSGKGVGIIIPTLLDWPESVIVLDPKDGENYDVTARWREQISNVHAFTPCRTPQTCINVLDAIRLGTPHAVGDADVIAHSLTAPAKLQGEGSTGAHFRELATLLLGASILHVCYTALIRSLGGVWHFLTQMHTRLSDALQAMVKTIHPDPDAHRAIVSMVRAIQNITGDRELSSVWSTAIRPLALYNDPMVAASTDTSDFSLDSLQYGQRPTSLYLIAPSPMALERLHPIYRVILDVATERLMSHKVRTWKHQLLYVLDELPWHGYCRAIDKGIAVQAGYGMRDLVVTQDLGGLFETFGEHTAIWGNCKVKVIHTPDNDLTAKRIAENILGPTTIHSTAEGASYGQHISRSQTTSPQRRLLLTTDEVLELPYDMEIIRMGGEKPVLAQKLDYRAERAWKGRVATNDINSRVEKHV